MICCESRLLCNTRLGLFVFCLLTQVMRSGVEERGQTIGHTGRSSPVSFGSLPTRNTKTMPPAQVSTSQNYDNTMKNDEIYVYKYVNMFR